MKHKSLALLSIAVAGQLTLVNAQVTTTTQQTQTYPVTTNQAVELPPVTLPNSTVSSSPAVQSTQPQPSYQQNTTDFSRNVKTTQGIITTTPSGAKEEWSIRPAPTATTASTPTTQRTSRPVAPSYQGPQVRTQNSDIPYLTGGIGLSEREDMMQQRKNFNLRLLFAVKGSGSYLSDTRVVITDNKNNTVLDAVSDGPWFYTNLKPGSYKLTLSTAGATQSRNITIPAKGAREFSFYWDAN